jgi:hypothetical protein
LNTLYIDETLDSKSRIAMPTSIAIPRKAPRMMSTHNSTFQVFTREVTISAIAVRGAIDECAMSERIAHLKKSLEPVLA